MLLSEIIADRICSEGPISFHDFMEMCLYYPELGYYTSAKDKIGSNGDYYTTPYLSSVYGEMLAKQIEEMWVLLDKKPFTIVEYGSGTGIMCQDIIDQLKDNPELFEQLNYCIIEKSPAMIEKQDKNICNTEKVSRYHSISDIPLFTGCVLSNEVLDNFSVHRVVMKDQLMEVYVDFQQGFVELLQPAPEALKDYLAQLKVTLPMGFCTEINLGALDWIKEISHRLDKGFVVTMDYGYASHELYCPLRNRGTLMCYYKHSVSDQLYGNIGKQDITAHINFSALHHWGAQYGLQCCGFTNQSHFLRALGLAGHFRNSNQRVDNPNNINIMHTLLTDLGSKIKILIQQKGLQNPVVTGLQFAHQRL